MGGEVIRKRSWRRAYLAQRRALRTVIRYADSHSDDVEGINTALLALLNECLPQRSTIVGYRASATEIDVSATLGAWESSGGRVIVPARAAFTGRGRGPVEWEEWSDPKTGEGEPLGSAGTAATLRGAEPPLGAVLLPGMAFGRDGRRLGRGAGWYDRALSQLPDEVLTVGLCRAGELVDAHTIPVEPHDRRVNVVLTPEALCVTEPETRD